MTAARFSGKRTLLIAAATLAAALAAPVWASAANPGQNGRIYFSACGDECPHYDVYSVSPDGTDLKDVTESLTGGAGLPNDAWEPSVSADGRELAFATDTQEESEIWVMNVDGSGARQLTSSAEKLRDQQPAISPDGSRVVWRQDSPFPSYSNSYLWSVGTDGAGKRLLLESNGVNGYPEFTPDGATIAFSDTDLLEMPSTPTTPPATSGTFLSGASSPTLIESEPSVSPDGQRIAYTEASTEHPSEGRDVFSIGIGGSAESVQQVYGTAADEHSPAYSPDGTEMALIEDGSLVIGSADGSTSPKPVDMHQILLSVADPYWAPAVVTPGGSGQGGEEQRKVPPEPGCVVPKLKGLKLRAARKKLRAAGCSLGKVKRLGRTDRAARVKKQSPKPGSSLAAGAKVGVKLKG